MCMQHTVNARANSNHQKAGCLQVLACQPPPLLAPPQPQDMRRSGNDAVGGMRSVQHSGTSSTRHKRSVGFGFQGI